MIKTYLMIVYMGFGENQMMVTEQFPEATMCETARKIIVEYYKENRNGWPIFNPPSACYEITHHAPKGND